MGTMLTRACYAPHTIEIYQQVVAFDVTVAYPEALIFVGRHKLTYILDSEKGA